ncbi:MAG: nucleotidyltransferase family protein [Candidatus Micrarchaeota archaeon]|nr:nucleotidyltransferase family protein [Candidatus Micrarchaeota archaeon]
MIRQAVILAAGKGRRMKESGHPQIANIPKPLIELSGLPIIERNLRKLSENKIEVAIVINPLDEDIFREKLGNYKIKYYYQEERLGTAHSLLQAKEFVKDELFLVLMGDDVIEYDMEMLLNTKVPTIFGFEVPDVTGYGAIIENNEGLVEEIIEKKISGKGLLNTGVYIMHKKFFDAYQDIPLDPKSGEYFITYAPKILAKYGIKFVAGRLSFWHGINTPEELERARGHPKIKLDE